MLESAQSSDWVITKLSSKSVAETVDRLKRLIEVRGFTLFRVMLAAPLAGLDLPLKILVWEDGNGAVSVSYNSPGFMAEKYRLDGALRAPFDAIESIVEAVVGA